MALHKQVTPELLREATGLVVRTQFGSQRMLTIALQVDYATAAKLLEELTDRGILGRSLAHGLFGGEWLRAREVLYTPPEYNDALARVAEQPSVRSR